MADKKDKPKFDPKVAKRLEEIARGIGTMIGDQMPEDTGFALCMFTFGEGGFFTHISNAERDDMVNVLDEWKAHLLGHPRLRRSGDCEVGDGLRIDSKGSAQKLDAIRYRRLRVLGCAVMNTPNLPGGNVSRFTNLDEIVDNDLRAQPSRGEAEPDGG